MFCLETVCDPLQLRIAWGEDFGKTLSPGGARAGGVGVQRHTQIGEDPKTYFQQRRGDSHDVRKDPHVPLVFDRAYVESRYLWNVRLCEKPCHELAQMDVVKVERHHRIRECLVWEDWLAVVDGIDFPIDTRQKKRAKLLELGDGRCQMGEIHNIDVGNGEGSKRSSEVGEYPCAR